MRAAAKMLFDHHRENGCCCKNQRPLHRLYVVVAVCCCCPCAPVATHLHTFALHHAIGQGQAPTYGCCLCVCVCSVCLLICHLARLLTSCNFSWNSPYVMDCRWRCLACRGNLHYGQRGTQQFCMILQHDIHTKRGPFVARFGDVPTAQK